MGMAMEPRDAGLVHQSLKEAQHAKRNCCA